MAFCKNISESAKQRILFMAELDIVNLEEHIERVAAALTQTPVTPKNLEFMVEVCMHLHEIYEEFSGHFVLKSVAQFKADSRAKSPGSLQKQFSRKRYHLKLLTELFLRGLFQHYKDIFPCLNELMVVSPEAPHFLFSAGVVSDYFKIYGEKIF